MIHILSKDKVPRPMPGDGPLDAGALAVVDCTRTPPVKLGGGCTENPCQVTL